MIGRNGLTTSPEAHFCLKNLHQYYYNNIFIRQNVVKIYILKSGIQSQDFSALYTAGTDTCDDRGEGIQCRIV